MYIYTRTHTDTYFTFNTEIYSVVIPTCFEKVKYIASKGKDYKDYIERAGRGAPYKRKWRIP